jgi:hypothetical protein
MTGDTSSGAHSGDVTFSDATVATVTLGEAK